MLSAGGDDEDDDEEGSWPLAWRMRSRDCVRVRKAVSHCSAWTLKEEEEEEGRKKKRNETKTTSQFLIARSQLDTRLQAGNLFRSNCARLHSGRIATSVAMLNANPMRALAQTTQSNAKSQTRARNV